VISLPPVFRYPGFRLYWLGVTFSQIGSRATVAANLWQVQDLTDSTLAVGIVSLLEGLALIVLGPIGGSVADRVDRRRLVQVAQAASLLASLALAALTLAGRISPPWIYASVLVVGAAAPFDVPARQSLIPALVPRDRIVDAFAVVVPSRQLAVLLGPSLAGVLIAAWGAGAVYAFDVATYAALIVTFAYIGFEKLDPPAPQKLWSSIAEGFGYVKSRPLIWQLMALDFVATFFGAYRVLLPALARDVFQVGASGYGLLASAPAVGSILGAGVTYRLRAFAHKGWLVLAATALYGTSGIALGYAPAFLIALVLAGALGFFDAVAVTVRQAVTQLETPDRLRGRVSALYQMVARGGPALGQAQMGALAAAIGGPLALAIGSALTLGYTVSLSLGGSTVRDYED